MLVNFTNHPSEKWTEIQKNAAIEKYNEIVDVHFPHINPGADELDIKAEALKYAEVIISLKPSAVHIMGEMNFTFQLVHLLMEEGIECIASTTERIVEDFADGSQKSSFYFVKFRSYNFLGDENAFMRKDSFQLSNGQQNAFDQMITYLNSEKDRSIFILKGYAGTGKTTLLKYFIEKCCNDKKSVTLMASTGRAAAVLKSKSKFNATTVHSIVYKFDEIKATSEEAWTLNDGETGQLYLNFASCVIQEEETSDIYIIDEASMVSGHTNESVSSTKFGSGNLLHDFLDAIGDAKVVFVGDPCQLPPVDEVSFSAALDSNHITTEYNREVLEVELTEIQRQAENSEILEIAGPIREQIVTDTIPEWPKITYRSRFRDVQIVPSTSELIQHFLSAFKTFGSGNTILITHKNSEAFENNHAIRTDLFPGKDSVQVGEILMVIKNCMVTGLRNGDQVIVTKVGERENRARLTFMKIQVKDINTGILHESMLIETLLNNADSGLDTESSRRVIIDFDERMKESKIQRNSLEYKSNMKTDPYLNALHAKYGYAITLQKAQGGEWRHVFLNVTKSVYISKHHGKPQDMLKWFYTAITRTQKYLTINAGSWIKYVD
jgi:ATP-dependent exoDNAse (exonuclease V) alpha subunit